MDGIEKVIWMVLLAWYEATVYYNVEDLLVCLDEERWATWKMGFQMPIIQFPKYAKESNKASNIDWKIWIYNTQYTMLTNCCS